MRRVWRLGQTQPVEVIFLSYLDTLEDLALSLMGKKLYAAQLLYGDEVGGAIVESDDGNFLTELARAAMSRVAVEDLSRLFADVGGGDVSDGDVVAESVMPMVSSAASEQTSVVETVNFTGMTMQAMRELAREMGHVRGRKQAKRPQAAQISFIGEEMGEALVQLALDVEA